MIVRNISIFLVLLSLFSIQQASSATIYTVNGTYDLDPQISYTCASGFCDLQYSTFTLVDDGETLTVQPAMNGYAYMVGPSAIDGHIDVSCFVSGGCTDTYTLEGDFITNDT